MSRKNKTIPSKVRLSYLPRSPVPVKHGLGAVRAGGRGAVSTLLAPAPGPPPRGDEGGEEDAGQEDPDHGCCCLVSGVEWRGGPVLGLYRHRDTMQHRCTLVLHRTRVQYLIHGILKINNSM